MTSMVITLTFVISTLESNKSKWQICGSVFVCLVKQAILFFLYNNKNLLIRNLIIALIRLHECTRPYFIF